MKQKIVIKFLGDKNMFKFKYLLPCMDTLLILMHRNCH